MSILVKNPHYKKAMLFCISICVLTYVKSYFNITFLAYVILLLLIICILSVKIECVLSVMLFLLPWAGILKVNSSSMTFMTLVLPFVFLRILISLKSELKINHLTLTILIFLVAFSLTSSFFSGNAIGISAFGFFILLSYLLLLQSNKELLPATKETTYLFNISLILAFASGTVLQVLPHMREHFKSSHVTGETIVNRFSSLNYDPNYNALQILMGISMLMIKISEDRKRNMFDLILLLLLIGIGVLSLSKMYLLMMIILIFVWIITRWESHFSGLRKAAIMTIMVLVTIYLYDKGILKEQINAYAYRLSRVTDMATLTTGRSVIFAEYLNYMLENPNVLLLGSGFTNEAILWKASHNTYIQVVFQIGIFGAVLLIIFIAEFINSMKPVGQNIKLIRFLPLFTLLLGAGALDLLLVDEFVYYVIISGIMLSKGYHSDIGLTELRK